MTTRGARTGAPGLIAFYFTSPNSKSCEPIFIFFQKMRHSDAEKLVKIKQSRCLISTKNMRGGQNLPPPPLSRVRIKRDLRSPREKLYGKVKFHVSVSCDDNLPLLRTRLSCNHSVTLTFVSHFGRAIFHSE